MKTTDLKIDPEFRALIPSLNAEEKAQLEEKLAREGCTERLTAWRNGSLTLVDGHNRQEICERRGIAYQIRELEFSDREAAKLWIEENQLGRRNLSDDQRAAIAYRMMKRRSEIAMRQQRSDAGKVSAAKRNGEDKVSTPLNKEPKDRTRAAVAKEAKIPERKVRSVAEVAKSKPELVDKIASGKMTTKEAAREVRQEKRKAVRAEAARDAEKIVIADDLGVKHGDFRTVAKEITDASLDLIFTDPPYDRKFLPQYGELAKIAARVLKPGASLICYLGQFQIDEVCKLVTPHLRLWWTLACQHTGTSARMTEYGIVVKWKPMLWFVKGTRGDKQTFVDDLIESRREKDAHEWQQSVVEASYYIDKLTLPGGTVWDPFCGGGTTAVAAKQLKRRCITCDTDEIAVKLARKRLHDCA